MDVKTRIRRYLNADLANHNQEFLNHGRLTINHRSQSVSLSIPSDFSTSFNVSTKSTFAQRIEPLTLAQQSDDEDTHLKRSDNPPMTLSLLFYGIIICLSTVFIIGCNQQNEVLGVPEVDSSINAGFDIGVEPDIHSEEPFSMSLPLSCRNDDITDAYATKQSGLQVKGCGQVQDILSDQEISGSAHQRFRVKLEDIMPELLVTVAHNTDISPRVTQLARGDRVVFYGEYEYTDAGGVVHSTHKDTTSDHQNGWVEHNGKRVQ